MWVRLDTTPLLLELYLSSTHTLHQLCPICYFCQKLPSSVKEKALIGIDNYSLLELRTGKLITCQVTNLNAAIFIILGCFSKLWIQVCYLLFICGLVYKAVNLNCLKLNGRMTGQRWITKDLERSSPSIIEAWNLLGKTGKPWKTYNGIAIQPVKIWARHLPNTSVTHD